MWINLGIWRRVLRWSSSPSSRLEVAQVTLMKNFKVHEWLLLCSTAVLSDVLYCQSPTAAGSPASASGTQMPITPPATQEAFIQQLKKTVVFVTGKYSRIVTIRHKDAADSREALQQEIRGTGYLIGIPRSETDASIQSTYVVTNRHMIREPGPDGTSGKGPYLMSIQVRVNTKTVDLKGIQYKAVDVPVMSNTGQFFCFVDTADPDADLAICPIPLDSGMDVKTIGPDSFLSRERLKQAGVDETNEIFFAGLFSSFSGVNRNYPVVRHGKIAMLAGERMPVLEAGRTAEVYLGDVMSFGGNSGSPVMVRYGGASDFGLGPAGYYLLGTMQGYFNVNVPITVQTAVAQGVAAENSGVAVIVPALKINEIISSSGMSYCRTQDIANFLGASGRSQEAFDMLLTIDRAASPSREYLWCEYLSHNGLVTQATLLKVNLQSLSKKVFTATLPIEASRTESKAAIHIVFTVEIKPFGLAADVFAIAETPDTLTVLPSGYEEASPSEFVISKQAIKSVTPLQ